MATASLPPFNANANCPLGLTLTQTTQEKKVGQCGRSLAKMTMRIHPILSTQRAAGLMKENVNEIILKTLNPQK